MTMDDSMPPLVDPDGESCSQSEPSSTTMDQGGSHFKSLSKCNAEKESWAHGRDTVGE